MSLFISVVVLVAMALAVVEVLVLTSLLFFGRVDGVRWLLFGCVIVWMRLERAEDDRTHFVEIFQIVVREGRGVVVRFQVVRGFGL